MPSKKQRAKANNAKAKSENHIGALSINSIDKQIAEMKKRKAKRMNKCLVDAVQAISLGVNNSGCRHGATEPINECQLYKMALTIFLTMGSSQLI